MIAGVRIGAAREAPAAELAALHARGFTPGWSEAEIARLRDLPNAIALAAHAPNVVGLLLGWMAGDDAEILTLAVAPERRRSGIGRALLAAGLAAARTMGARSLYLEVGEDNAAARAFYAGAGFREIGRRVGYYSRGEGGVDALILKLTLENSDA
jgi:ribosomal-protein-alanine N-acetyltransferase